MRRFYQPKGECNRGYRLRDNTYRRVWYLIADYYYFKEQLGGTLQLAERETEYLAGGGSRSGAVMQAARYVKAIEDAQKQIPEVYVDFVMGHIVDRLPYKDMEVVSEKTIKIWMQRFIWHVAVNLGEV